MSSREMRSGKREREKESEERAKETERHKKTKEDKQTDSSPRPKRITVQKALEYNHGLLWKEETDLKKALYMSLQDSKKTNMGVCQEENINSVNSKDKLGSSINNKKKLKNPDKSENEKQEVNLKKTKVHAQRKFAQGSHPNSPVTTPIKFKSTTTNLIPSKRPKTEDFLTFLCLRGTTALPPSLDFFNLASRSNVQAVSDSRCQTPVTPELSNQSSPFTRDHSNRASPVTSEHSNGILNPSSEKGAKKSSDFKQIELDIKVKKETKKYKSRDNLDNKKREKSNNLKRQEHSESQSVTKSVKERQDALKKPESSNRTEIRKKSERKESVECKSSSREDQKSPKKKKVDHRETRSEKHQENKDSANKSKDNLKRHSSQENLKKDIKKEINDLSKKMESKDKEVLKKHDKEKRLSIKDSLKKIDGKDVLIKDSLKKVDGKDGLKKVDRDVSIKDSLKKADSKDTLIKDSFKKVDSKDSFKKADSKDVSKKTEKDVAKDKETNKHFIKKNIKKKIMKKLDQLKSKTRAGQKRERKELLEKQERLKKRKEERLKEKKDSQEKLKDKKDTQEKSKEKKELTEKQKEKEVQDKLKEIKPAQDKKEKKESLEKLKEKKEAKEKKETQGKLKEKKEAQEKSKDKKEPEKAKEKKEHSEKVKKDFGDKKDIQDKNKVNYQIDRREFHERIKATSGEKKDLAEKLKGSSHAEKKEIEKKNVLLEKKEQLKVLSLSEKREMLEKTRSTSQTDKKDQEKTRSVSQTEKKDQEKTRSLSQAEKKDQEKSRNLSQTEKKDQDKIRSVSQSDKKDQEKGKAVTEKKELDRSKNTLMAEKKETHDKIKSLSQGERKEAADKNKSLTQGDGLLFKRDESRDRSMDPIVVVKARDTVGHRIEGGNKSQMSRIITPLSIHVTSHRESARVLEQSFPYFPKLPTPPLSLSPVPPPLTVSKLKPVPPPLTVNKLKPVSPPLTVSKLKPQISISNLQVKKIAKVSVKKTIAVLTPTSRDSGDGDTEKIEKKQRFMRKRKLSDNGEEKPAKKRTPNKIMPISADSSSVFILLPAQVPLIPKGCESTTTLKSQEAITPVKTLLKPPRHSKVSSFTTSPLRMPLPGSPDVSPPSKRRGRPPGKRSTLDPSQIHLEPFPDVDATAKMVDAPVYHPSEEEFNDPLIYIDKIREEAEKYGICSIVPPPSWKPECIVSDDMRINSSIQYVHKMLYRWGPNVQQVECMRKHLETQEVTLGQSPLIGGIELDLCKLYQSIHYFGGMQQVNEKKKWNKVADSLRIPKASHDRVPKLYEAYCKYLVSYDTLSKEDQQKLDQQVTAERQKKRYRSSDPNLNCVVRGRTLSLSGFYRVARNILAMWFKQAPSHQEAEHEFWRVVTERLLHTAVHSGTLDTKVCGSGFPSHKASPFAKHGWNLNVSSHNSGNTLRSLGSLPSITVPTLHIGMLYTASCWYRDPHFLPRIEYLHTGADKIWYCIPKSHGEVFHQAMKTAVPEYCVKTPIWLPSETIMVPPFMLVANGVSLCRLVQHAGQFVVVFSQAYSASICCGYNISESISYARPDWLNICPLAFKNLKESCEPSQFSLERLLLSIADDNRTHLDTLQKILPMLEEIRDVELKLRKQLFDIGLKTCEKKTNHEESESKSRRIRIHEDEEEGVCDVCRCCCYLSMVVNELEDSVYCLQHAINLLQKKKNFKNWKLVYRLDQATINEVLQKISGRLSSAASSPKKKSIPKSPKL